MTFQTRYRLHITPLSPVHIGTSESYDPTQYVIEDDLLHEFDVASALKVFTKEERSELLSLSNGRPDTKMLKGFQSFFYKHREKLLVWAIKRVPVCAGVAKLYKDRIGQTAQRETQNREVINKLEIDRCAYSPVSRTPILYGSSLKGAIRTAVLNKENNGNKPLYDERKGLHPFQGRIFKYLNRTNNRLELEKDPFNLIQLVDAIRSSEATLHATEIHLAVNRKKAPVKDAQGILRPAMGENLYQILECVRPWQYRAFTGQINIRDLSGLSEKYSNTIPELQYDLKKIANACNTFYLANFGRECKILKSQGLLDKQWSTAVNQILEMAKDKIGSGTALLIRVGRHSGAEALTLDGVRNIKIMKGNGQNPDYAPTPKTVWMAADNSGDRDGLLPFGWLLIEIEPLDSSVTEWPELKKICEEQSGKAKEVAQRLESLNAKIILRRVEEENRLHEEAEKARVDAEKEQKKKLEDAEAIKRLEAMSDNGRKVESLKGQKSNANQNKRHSDVLYSSVTKTIQDAQDWSEEDKKYLRKVSEEIFIHLGIKKDQYKKIIRDLPQ